MQTLDVISVNLWQILISLLNLVLLFLILKKFLFKPVTAMLARRKSELDAEYAAAASERSAAEDLHRTYEEQLSHAKSEADGILSRASENAKRRSETLLQDARERADGMIRGAENEIELMHRRADEEIRQRIVEVSGALTEKLLAREMKDEDHRALIEDFLFEMEDGND